MRACTRCGVVKALDAFPPVRRGEPKLQTWCRECFAAYGKVYYSANREAQKARLRRNVQATREQNRLRTVEYLLRHPCVDCGNADIVVLQFDHMRDKTADIARLVASGRTWAAIVREIEKCEVRCSNCHRRKTAQRRIPRTAPELDRVRRPPMEQLRIEDALSRRCRVCRDPKSLALFPYRSRVKRTRQHICLACQREVTRAWYVRNKSPTRDGYMAMRRKSERCCNRASSNISTRIRVSIAERLILLSWTSTTVAERPRTSRRSSARHEHGRT